MPYNSMGTTGGVRQAAGGHPHARLSTYGPKSVDVRMAGRKKGRGRRSRRK